MPAATAQPALGLQLRHAVALGLLHGPTELLPISSSGHTALLGWVADLDYDKLDPAARKRFEVALHAGALAGLLLVARFELARALAEGPEASEEGLHNLAVHADPAALLAP